MVLRPLTDDDRAAFERDGFIGPFPVLGPAERRAVVRDARVVDRTAAWYRGLHEWDTAALELARRPDVVAGAATLLGPDLLLWGIELARRIPSLGHYWHSDVEAVAGPTLNVWIGLERVDARTPFLVVPGSHRYGVLPQDLHDGELRNDEVLLELARRYDPEAAIQELPVRDGDAVLFAGDLWHATRHDGTHLRKAIALLFCPPTTNPRRPMTYTSPVVWHDDPQPCVAISGQVEDTVNRLIEPAPPSRAARAGGLVTAVDERAHDLVRTARGWTRG